MRCSAVSGVPATCPISGHDGARWRTHPEAIKAVTSGFVHQRTRAETFGADSQAENAGSMPVARSSKGARQIRGLRNAYTQISECSMISACP
jgi:hypothetical protein